MSHPPRPAHAAAVGGLSRRHLSRRGAAPPPPADRDSVGRCTDGGPDLRLAKGRPGPRCPPPAVRHPDISTPLSTSQARISTMSGTRRGFTLIELLVVIAIIAILI